jgi:hypothetical protein
MGDPVRLTLPIPPSVNRGRFPVVDKARRTVNGIVFDSRKEAVRYSELLLLQRAGEITSLEPQVECKVVINRKHFCTFTVDFYYVDKRRNVAVYEEIKSSGTAKDAAYRLRRKAAELFHGIVVTELIR